MAFSRPRPVLVGWQTVAAMGPRCNRPAGVAALLVAARPWTEGMITSGGVSTPVMNGAWQSGLAERCCASCGVNS